MLQPSRTFREMWVSVTPLIEPLADMNATPLTAPQLLSAALLTVTVRFLTFIVAPAFSTTAPTNAAPEGSTAVILYPLPLSV